MAVRAFAGNDLAPPVGDAPLSVRPQWLPVDRYADHKPTQAAGAALLRLAWVHHSMLWA